MEQASLLVSVLQNGCWRRDSYFLTDQTLQPLISLQLHLEKGSTRYFKKQQWILKSLVRYSVSKTSVICLTISPCLFWLHKLYERRGNINCKKYDLVNKQIDTGSRQLDWKIVWLDLFISRLDILSHSA